VVPVNRDWSQLTASLPLGPLSIRPGAQPCRYYAHGAAALGLAGRRYDCLEPTPWATVGSVCSARFDRPNAPPRRRSGRRLEPSPNILTASSECPRSAPQGHLRTAKRLAYLAPCDAVQAVVLPNTRPPVGGGLPTQGPATIRFLRPFSGVQRSTSRRSTTAFLPLGGATSGTVPLGDRIVDVVD
jgi:hypothetical protein